MKDTAPISLGIIAVSLLFGIVAAGVAMVAFDYALAGGFFIGLVVAIVTAIVLAIGWRDPMPGPQGASAAASEAAPAVAREPEAAPAAAPEPEPAAVPETVVEPEPEPEAVAEPEPEPTPEPTPEPAPVSEPAPSPAPAASDGKPAALSAARNGGPDDLKQIKGVGKKLEATLHEMGIYHFDQIAEWGPAEQAWMDDNLKGFKGRATRDNWVEQARTLAAGGTTEFSSKVKKGDVY